MCKLNLLLSDVILCVLGSVSKDFGTYARWHDLQLISYHRTGHMSKLLSCALNHWTRQDLTRIDCDCDWD